jgi:hypothetical protein
MAIVPGLIFTELDRRRRVDPNFEFVGVFAVRWKPSPSCSKKWVDGDVERGALDGEAMG